MRIRLDNYLVEKGYCETRNKAQALIMSGQVLVEGRIHDKAGSFINIDQVVAVKEKFPYVSRGASKIEQAFNYFNLDFEDKVICDIGASTGGFSDFALQHGAKKIYAVDVGHGQLDQKLRDDARVVSMEKTDFRHIESLPEVIDYFLGDVSFISLEKILPKIKALAHYRTNVVVLIKPQFEAGIKEVSRGKGVIRDEQTRLAIVENVKNFAKNLNYKIIGFVESPILGAKGNKEYLLYLKLI